MEAGCFAEEENLDDADDADAAVSLLGVQSHNLAASVLDPPAAFDHLAASVLDHQAALDHPEALVQPPPVAFDHPEALGHC